MNAAHPDPVQPCPSPDRDVETHPVGTDDHQPDGPTDLFRAAVGANPNPGRITDQMWQIWLACRDLAPGSELGGFYALKKGYHSTRADNRQRWPGDYSIREAEDQAGPDDKAAAFDWTFPEAQRGDTTRIAVYTRRLLASGRDRNDPRLDDLREFYGNAGGDSRVDGWDCRHLVPVTSDSSHLWHIHISVDRGKVTSGAMVAALLSVLRGESLAQWRAEQTIPAPAPVVPVGHRPGSRVLRLTSPQMTGDDVVFVQRWIGPARAGQADGVYGPGTAAGVRWYQRMRGIGVDGEVGPVTWAQMGVRMSG